MPFIAAIAANIIFGFTIVAVRMLVTETDPFGIAFVRYLFATAMFLPFLLRIRWKSIPGKDYVSLIFLGIIQFGIFPITYTYSLSLTYASRGAIIFANVPLLTYLLSCLFRYDRFSILRLLGTVMALIGVALALGGKVPLEAPPTIWVGDGWMLVTILMGASYNVLSRPMIQRYPPMTTTSIYFLSGTVFLGLMTIPGGHVTALSTMESVPWLVLTFAGTVGGGLSYFLFNYALQTIGPTQVAIFVPLSPVTAAILSAFWLGEPITVWFVVGLAAVLIGIVLVTNPRLKSSM